MFCLARLCRICVTKAENMKSLYSMDTDSITYHQKLLTCVPELKSDNFDNKTLLCEKCCQKLKHLYAFRDLCRRNKSVFEGYILQLNQDKFTRKPGELLVNLEKIAVNADVNKGKSATMTVPTREEIKESFIDNSFVFDMSPADELRPENCVRVEEMCTTTNIQVDGVSNIEDLSQSSEMTFFGSFNFENGNDLSLENTDGEIRIERGESACMDEYEESHEVVEELNKLQEVSTATNSQIEIVQECSNEMDLLKTFDIQSALSEDMIFDDNFQCLPFKDIDISNSSINEFEPVNLGSIQLDPITLEPIQTEENTIILFSQISNNFAQQAEPKPKPIIQPEIQPKPIIDLKPEPQPIDTSPVKCDICSKTYKDIANVKRHKNLMHSGERPFKCKFCDKTFSTNYCWKRHAKTHAIVRPFKCDMCEQHFTNTANLKRHKFLHNAEATFKCESCDDKFQSPASLKNHMKVHVGQTSYECEICGDSFKRMYDLKTHKRSHTGQRSFECDVCKKTFSAPGSVRRHKQAVHNQTLKDKVDSQTCEILNNDNSVSQDI